MTDEELREEFMDIYFGTRPQTSDAILEVAMELYGVLKRIELLVANAHTSELDKIMEIKSVLKQATRRGQNSFA